MVASWRLGRILESQWGPDTKTLPRQWLQVTVVLMVTANQSRQLVSALSGSSHKAAQTSLAGTILLIISNIILVRRCRGWSSDVVR